MSAVRWSPSLLAHHSLGDVTCSWLPVQQDCLQASGLASGLCLAGGPTAICGTSHKHNVVLNGITMTSSVKLELHNVLQRRQRGPSHSDRQHAQKIGEFGHAVFQIICCRQTHRQTYSLQYFATIMGQSNY